MDLVTSRAPIQVAQAQARIDTFLRDLEERMASGRLTLYLRDENARNEPASAAECSCHRI